MADDRIQSVSLDWMGGFEFSATFEGIDVPPLKLDEAPPVGHGKGPNPAALLAAAVGSCLASSLVFCLNKSRVKPDDLRVRARAHITRNEAGRFRISAIDVEITPDVRDIDANRLLRCEDLYEDFCIVTESIRHGVPVTVSLAQPHEAPRPAA
jgi:uncharacterized OsmC-like protein